MMAAAAAIIGLAIAGGLEPGAVALIFLAVFLITGAGNAVNDYYDREIDAVNRPNRPIPSGRIQPRTAFRYSLALFAVGCIMAGLVSQICFAVAVFNSALLFFYARNLKFTPLAGNVSVAFLTGSTFLFGGAAAGPAGLLANQVPFGLSFLASMSREIAKDIEDIVGDRARGSQDAAHSGGRAPRLLPWPRALPWRQWCSASLLLLVELYLAIVTVADLFFLLSVLKIARGEAAGSQKAIKIGMAVALVAFLAAAIFP